MLAVAYLMMAPGGGWNMDAHYALIRALANGTPTIDKTRLEVDPTRDVSIINGHYYAAKSPGLAFATLPAYLVLKAAGGAKPVAGDRAAEIKQLWYLTIWGAVLPAAILLLLVYLVADRLEPGYGLAAAVTLGAGTMVLPFATLFFAHSLSSMLVFAAFAVLWRERRGPARLSLVLAAGLLAGLAATTDFPDAVPGAIVGLYVLARQERVRRAAAYGAGALLGGLPTLLFNQWAFGTPFKFGGYANVSLPGVSHANKAGLYGVTAPSFRAAAELLFAPIGLLTLMPVLVLGAVGAVLIYRNGHKAEALLIGGVAAGNLLLISAYNGGDTATNGPLGGGTPGPRFLMPMLPFLALGIAAAYRRLPVTTLALAVASAVQMIVITMTNPVNAPNIQLVPHLREARVHDDCALLRRLAVARVAGVPRRAGSRRASRRRGDDETGDIAARRRDRCPRLRRMAAVRVPRPGASERPCARQRRSGRVPLRRKPRARRRRRTPDRRRASNAWPTRCRPADRAVVEAPAAKPRVFATSRDARSLPLSCHAARRVALRDDEAPHWQGSRGMVLTGRLSNPPVAVLSSPLSSRARRSLPLRRRSTSSARRRSATWRLRRGSPCR